MSSTAHAAVLVSFPVAAAVIGATVTSFFTLSAKVTSAVPTHDSA